MVATTVIYVINTTFLKTFLLVLLDGAHNAGCGGDGGTQYKVNDERC